MSSPTLSDAERRALGAAASPPKSFRAGGVLLREGDAVDHLHFLTEGWACRYITTREGLRQIVALHTPGDTANLDALMFERPDYGVRVLTAAKVAAIPRKRALALAAEHPGVARTFTLMALAENAVLSQWAACIGRLTARQRIAHLFCELSARLDREEGNRSSFELPLTQEQIADALGLTSVHVNRTMQQLRAAGEIATVNRVLTIPDVARLRDAGEFNPAYLHKACGVAV